MRHETGTGLLSSRRNKKLITVAGAIMIAIGVAGMIAIGSQVVNILAERGEFANSEVARSYFYSEYVFVFLVVGGLILMISGLVSMQVKKRPAAR